MGWQADAAGHEGYLVGFDERGRELRDQKRTVEIKTIAVGCECGWRSPMLIAPAGTKWAPSSVWLDEHHEELTEDFARAMWKKHVDALRGVRVYGSGRMSLRELVEHEIGAGGVETIFIAAIDRNAAKAKESRTHAASVRKVDATRDAIETRRAGSSGRIRRA